MQKIVSLTQQADIRSIPRAKPSKRLDVIEFEKRPSLAASAVGRDERAPTVVSTMRLSPHRHAQVAPAFARGQRVAFADRGFDCS